MRMLRLLAPIIGLLLAACAPEAPPADPAAACLAGLDQRHVVYQRVKDWQTPEGCGISQAVRVERTEAEWNHPGLMTCSLASVIADYERDVLQPEAKRLFGHGVKKIWNAGSYDCRGERSDNHPERLSQHALGKAIDITGFEIDDGTVISVLHDWSSKGTKGQYLRAVAKGACDHFNVVLTPNHNAFHRDHIHMDIGPYKLCGL